MLCKKPFKGFGCGQCIYCRVNKMQDKANRIMMEAYLHEKTSFVTLTYSDNHLPSDCSLNPDDLRYFFMRLRSRIAPARIRYFACGEYGGYRFGSNDATREINPHYHLALYGLDYTDADLIQETWGLGLADVKFLEPASALYLAKYVTKKMTGKEDERLRITEDFCLHPEFQRQSLKPGLGAGLMEKFSKSFDNPYMMQSIDITGDVPKSINIGGREMGLGRYLKTKLRSALGFINTGAQDGWLLQKSMQGLLEEEQQFQKIASLAENKNEAENVLAKKARQYKTDIKQMKRSIIDERLQKKKDGVI